MPTGLTYQLEEVNFNVPRWLRETMIRQFGCCAILRDSGHMTPAEIRKACIKEDKDSYHAKELKSAQVTLTKLEKRTQVDWEKALNTWNEKRCADWNKEFDKMAVKSKKYVEAVSELNTLAAKAKTEILQKVIKFSLEQLEMVKSEFDPPAKPKPMALEDFKKMELDSARHDIAYHTTALKEEQACNEDHKKVLLAFYEEMKVLCP